MTAERSTDPWKTLESAWLEPSDRQPLEDIARRAASLGRRHTRIARLVRATELMVCLIFGALATMWLWQGSAPQRVAGGFVLTVVVGTAFLRRRDWLDSADLAGRAPGPYLDALLVGNASARRALGFGYVLLVIEVVFFAIWLPWSHQFQEDGEGSYLFLAFWTLLFIVGLELCRRSLDRERKRLESLRIELGDPVPLSPGDPPTLDG